jgi:hypothetical protein
MSTIIAGMFDTVHKAERAMQLLEGEFGEQDVCTFANNPPGQHDAFPIGGDEDEDPGSTHADKDAGKGAAVGVGAGAAIGAVVGGPPGAAIGAGIGAYVGSLAGALHGMEGRGSKEHPMRRPAGIVVAVRTEGGTAEQKVVTTMQTQGASHVEKANGQWQNGTWVDFDPVSIPVILYAKAAESSGGGKET